MSISVEEVKKIIDEDIKEKYGKIVKFEVTSAKYYPNLKNWSVSGNFSYEITNKTLLVDFYYAVSDGKRIVSSHFDPR
jgi:uncharacterized protein YjgD (DUF1641 family)